MSDKLVRIKNRYDSAENWNSDNPVLAKGEIGIDSTNNIIKVGNGSDKWDSLSTIVSKTNICIYDTFKPQFYVPFTYLYPYMELKFSPLKYYDILEYADIPTIKVKFNVPGFYITDGYISRIYNYEHDNFYNNVNNIMTLKAYPLTDANITESDYLTLKFNIYCINYDIYIDILDIADNDIYKLFGYNSDVEMNEDINNNNAKPICHFEFISGDNFAYHSIDE